MENVKKSYWKKESALVMGNTVSSFLIFIAFIFRLQELALLVVWKSASEKIQIV